MEEERKSFSLRAHLEPEAQEKKKRKKKARQAKSSSNKKQERWRVQTKRGTQIVPFARVRVVM